MPATVGTRRRISGTVEQLRAQLGSAHANGELVSLTPPTTIDGRVFTTYVELTGDQRIAATATHRRQCRKPQVIASTALVVVAGAGWGAFELATWVQGNAEMLIGGTFVFLVAVAAAMNMGLARALYTCLKRPTVQASSSRFDTMTPG